MVHILVAEDDDGFREKLVTQLKQSGHTVDAVENGIEAHRKIVSEAYDLVISDNRMPGIEGNELIGELRGSGKKKDTPFVLYTYGGKATLQEIAKERMRLFDGIVIAKSHDTDFPVSQIPEFLKTKTS
jgi:two-component system response regulator GlrR